jgi:peptidoglycan biosynthesis protein MviN/MurJ (putative lipid II flippase)
MPMFPLKPIVRIMLGVLIACVVCGLLYWLIGYCESEFPGFPLMFHLARVLLVILVVIGIIYFLLQISGYDVFTRGP